MLLKRGMKYFKVQLVAWSLRSHTLAEKQDQIVSKQDQIQSTLNSAMPRARVKSPESHVAWSPCSKTPLVHPGSYQPLYVAQPHLNPYEVESIPSFLLSDPELWSFLHGLFKEELVLVMSAPDTAVDLPLFSSLSNQSDVGMGISISANQSQPPFQVSRQPGIVKQPDVAGQPAELEQHCKQAQQVFNQLIATSNQHNRTASYS